MLKRLMTSTKSYAYSWTGLMMAVFLCAASAQGQTGWSYDSNAGTLTADDNSWVLNVREYENSKLAITGVTSGGESQAVSLNLAAPVAGGGYSIARIDDMPNLKTVLFGDRNISSLTFPDTLEYIGNYAFYYNNGNNLVTSTDLTIPGNVKIIGISAFEKCTGLTGTLVLENGVQNLQKKAFSGCGFTGSLVLPSSLTNVGASTFSYTPFSGYLTIPATLSSVGTLAFESAKFTGLNIESAATQFGTSAFIYCDEMRGDLVIPNGTTSIPDYLFQDCRFNGNLILPSSLKTIGKEAFRRVPFKGPLTVPDSVTKIGNNAFQGGESFAVADLPSTGVTLGDQIFRACSTNLTSVIFRGAYPSSVSSINLYQQTPDVVTYVLSQYVDSWNDHVDGLIQDGNAMWMGRPIKLFACSVTFDKDFDTANRIEIIPQTYGSVYMLPLTPSREGHTFRGWFTERNGEGTQITSDILVDCLALNQVLYAFFPINRGWTFEGIKRPIITAITPDIEPATFAITVSNCVTGGGVFYTLQGTDDLNAKFTDISPIRTVESMSLAENNGVWTISSVPRMKNKDRYFFRVVASSNNVSNIPVP